ncbi:DUF4280 domain-containing protein [Flavobacterium ginsengiterrae]|uniref:DUF4280 domain-containing protein n=1 Tax=Flavobacterium ginsengiterrae TaxID=871695 RepID=A0ABP7GDT2_9FLAO
MGEKHMVVQGAVCKCAWSKEGKTDILKVKTHSKHFANDKGSAKKLQATTKEIGKTFELNSFGSCRKQPLGNDQYKVCIVDLTEWKNPYEKITLSNEGKVLLEDSKATCSMGTPNCIEIVKHGQVSEPSVQNFQKADPDVQNRINPLLKLHEAGKPEFNFNGIEQN